MRRHPSKRLRQEEGGFILFLVLTFTTLLGLGSVLAMSGTLGAILSTGNQLRDKRAFFQADGSAALCWQELTNRIQTALPARLASLTNISAVTPYVPNDPNRPPNNPAGINDPAGFLVDYAYQSGTSFGGQFIKDSNNQARLPLTFTASAAPAPYTCTLTVTARGAPIDLNQGLSQKRRQYLFRYSYAIDGTATDAGLTRQVNLQGTFSVLVQQDPYARFALLTNQQRNASGTLIWFTNRNSFSGPVHTNGQFNFANNPGSHFTGQATSVSAMANFYNNNSPVSLNADRNGDVDVPVFDGGFTRGASNIPMPAATDADGQRAKALGGTSTSGSGVYLGTTADGKLAGIYVNGNATISLGLGAANTRSAQYTITQSITQGHPAKTTTTTTTVRVDYAANQTTIQQGNNPATAYNGIPNGMLFVDGRVDSLAGTVQRDTELTVAATGDVMITGNIMYENFTAGASPSAEGFTNMLGIISWSGNVRITDPAPDNINVHATVMTPTGEFTVDNWDTRRLGGTATILGGVIENTYGSFGLYPYFGYGRNFVFDTRMGKGKAPPFFPTIPRVISTVFGINDRPNWQQTN